jgi:hypothetical protein
MSQKESLFLKGLKAINKVISYTISHWVNLKTDIWAQVFPNRTANIFERAQGSLDQRSLDLCIEEVYLSFLWMEKLRLEKKVSGWPKF